MKKKILSSLLLVLFIASISNCKRKIAKYPVKMEGLWYGVSTGCGFILEINKNSTGKMTCLGGNFCNSGEIAEGKIEYKKSTLFINKSKFTFTQKPYTVTSIDSIYIPGEIAPDGIYKKYKVLTRMSFEKKSYEEEIIWYKYKEY